MNTQDPNMQRILQSMLMGGQLPQSQPQAPMPQQSTGPMSPPIAESGTPPIQGDTAQMLFNLHERVKQTDPELAATLWSRIQPLTGDF